MCSTRSTNIKNQFDPFHTTIVTPSNFTPSNNQANLLFEENMLCVWTSKWLRCTLLLVDIIFFYVFTTFSIKCLENRGETVKNIRQLQIF